MASQGAIGALFLWLPNTGKEDWNIESKPWNIESNGGLEYRIQRWTSAEMSVTCGLSLLKTLQHMHAHNVAHRDLKTSNVSVDNTGEVTVIDLGGIVPDLNKALVEDFCYLPAKEGSLEKVPDYHVSVELRLLEHEPGFYVDSF